MSKKQLKEEDSNVYLTPLSKPEIISIQTQENEETVILRMGFYSKKNEASYDINKILTKKMVEDLITNLSKAISKEERDD